MHYFDSQRIDEAGNTGVRLQKVLIFMGVVDVALAIFGLPMSLVTLAISLGLLATAFYGAKHRNPTLLKVYVIIRIIMLTLGLIGLILGVGISVVLYELVTNQIDTSSTINTADYYDVSATTIISIIVVVVVLVGLVYSTSLGFIIYTIHLACKMRRMLLNINTPTPDGYSTVSQVADYEMQQMPTVYTTPDGQQVMPVYVPGNGIYLQPIQTPGQPQQLV